MFHLRKGGLLVRPPVGRVRCGDPDDVIVLTLAVEVGATARAGLHLVTKNSILKVTLI